MAPALFILGVGTGASFSSIYDVALATSLHPKPEVQAVP